MTLETAQQLGKNGFAVFPVSQDKKPYTENGFLDASTDPDTIATLFKNHPNALIGIATGASGIIVLDLDYKVKDGNVVVDGYDSLATSWNDVPESYAYTSVSGQGRHIYYVAPEGKHLPRKTPYRGMPGVDRLSGEGFAVFAGTEIPKKESLAPAPQWLCDEGQVRSSAAYEGTVNEWFESLEPGEPNAAVRAAITRVHADFESAGKDFDHGALIERQYEAVRLGAEGNPGVPVLLETLEELFLSRTGAHSRPEEEWQYEFAEGLASGIEKYGDAIELRKALPDYDPASLLSSTIPTNLLQGNPGGAAEFRALLGHLMHYTPDDYLATSVLWNSPVTKDVSHEWGLEFVYKRVTDARTLGVTESENPVAKDSTPEVHSLLTDHELEKVVDTHTFIDEYITASASKGFSVPTYDIPAAWSALSMAFGGKAYIATGDTFGVNLWFHVLGNSGTGKTTSDKFLTYVLDGFMRPGDDEAGYNLGALSSIQGMQETLLRRDKLSSIVHHDEATILFQSVKNNEWMSSLLAAWGGWYSGKVEGSSNLRLKELRNKEAETSFNVHMLATPDKLLSLLDATMFETGHMARMNWVWNEAEGNTDAKFEMDIIPTRTSKIPEAALDLASYLATIRTFIKEPVMVTADPGVGKRLSKAYRAMDKIAKSHERYSTVIEPALTRLARETMWKCAALLALSRGASKITSTDALVAIYYAEDWFRTLLKVANQVAESPYSREAEAMESFIRANGEVRRAALFHHFRGTIVRSYQELDNRLDFLLNSARIIRTDIGKEIGYRINS